VTEPGLQANSPAALRSDLHWNEIESGQGRRKIAFFALTTCSNVTRAQMATVDTARSKADKGDGVERTVRTPDGRTLAEVHAWLSQHL
jgi:hypothetical protein